MAFTVYVIEIRDARKNAVRSVRLIQFNFEVTPLYLPHILLSSRRTGMGRREFRFLEAEDRKKKTIKLDRRF